MTDARIYLKGLTILYVEDDSETRSELKKFLSRRAKVIAVSDGVQAMNVIDDIEPDIIIADLIMPNMDGIEMIQQIRKKYPLIKIIITSTVNEMKTILNTVEIGIVKYIIKPIILTELEESLLKCANEIQQLRPGTIELPPEERKQIESHIKKDLSSIIKKAAGKGPRDIAVFIHDDSIDAVVYDAFTSYEHTLLQNRDNYGMIEQCRRSFYNILIKEMNEAVSNAWHNTVNMDTVETNTHNLTDKLCFKVR